jgi:nucleotide-binding universal stress UspA family protein
MPKVPRICPAIGRPRICFKPARSVFLRTPPLDPNNLTEAEQKAKDNERSIETLVRMGRAQSEIPDTAKAIGADLIVLGTHGYSGPKHALLGGTAERVVRQAACPVLTVRRSGSS